MTLDNLRRRLGRIEQRAGIGPAGLGYLPTVRIITHSDEDRDRQLADLTASGAYTPGQRLIVWRVITPDPRMKAEHEAWQRGRLGGGPLQ